MRQQGKVVPPSLPLPVNVSGDRMKYNLHVPKESCASEALSGEDSDMNVQATGNPHA